MTSALHVHSWSWARLDEAIGHLGDRLAGTAAGPGGRPSDLAPIAGGDVPAELPRVCAAHGLDCDFHPLHYGVVRRLVAPAIVRLPAAGESPAFLIVAERRPAGLVVLSVDGDWQHLSLLDFEAGLQAAVDADARHAAQILLDEAGVDRARRADACRALLSEQLADVVVADCWSVSMQPGTRIGALLRTEGVVRQLGQLLTMHGVQFVLWLAAWSLIGRAALDGRTDWGWMTAWALLIATLVPLQIWTGWTQGIVALGLGRVLKRRFLAGAVRLDADELRLDGAGRMLGRVLESGAVETMAVSGGLLAVLAVVELVVSAWALWYGAAGGWLVAWLLTCIVGLTLGALALLRRRGAWADAHLVMTHHLVERIAGHRTRLAQESPDRRHDDEDTELAAYTRRGLALDRLLPAFVVGLPRAWIVGGLLLVAPAFATGRPAHTLAIALGGLLLSAGALRRCGEGLSQLAGAAIAWREARALFDAAARPAHTPRDVGHGAGELPVVQLREVAYQYPGRTAPVLVDCTLAIAPGDRVLLDGPSGGGKSTLAAIIAGLRTPTAGLVMAGGFDHATLGPHGWRKRVVCAPQFHENHVFCETFAFNLLMGRRWPAAADELADAETVARELGLGPLLERMPAGMMQMVGEGGWQLSHGERSRLFIARALLQGSDLVVLDESLAALDPETSEIVLDCVVARARSLMVIAHE